jgi:subtilisin family serine protease
VELRTSSINLRERLQEIRTAVSATQRRALLTQLDQLVATDQGDLATLITSLGGTIERHYWVVNALAVEVPVSALDRIRAHQRVRRLVPVRSRGPAEAGSGAEAMPAPPIGASTDDNNHRVQLGRQILQAAGITNTTGEGVVVAIVDTGVDADASAGLGTPHPAFVDGAGATRIVGHFMAGNIDCNNFPAPALTYQPCAHSRHARHGTGVAAIVAGRQVMDPLTTPPLFVSSEGHAPGARIVDVSIITVPEVWSPNLQRLVPAAWAFWRTDDATMLGGIQALRTHILSSDTGVYVANISFDGWSDPDDPVPAAWDALAQDEDVVLINAAGNAADETRLSNGFYHGLSVGSVHARLDPQAEFVPMADTSRGPLSSNWSRLFPDVCATGAGGSTDYVGGGVATLLQMPLLDLFDSSSRTGCASAPPEGVPIPAGPIYYARGTSQASPHVAGAAAVYRGARPQATAEETRAALLLNTVSPLPGPGGSSQHTYRNRNTFGVGYVRNDLLAEFAARDQPLAPAIRALHQVVQLQPSAPNADVTYAGVAPGRYAAAICWQRYPINLTVGPSFGPLPNVDLEVWAGTTLLARSVSPANAYERVAFAIPTGVSTVTLRVLGVSLPANLLPVQVVAREFLDPATPQLAVTGSVTALPQGAACAAQAPDLRVTRVVPTAYDGAYGSMPFVLPRQDATNQYRSLDLGSFRPFKYVLLEVAAAQMGGPMTIGALAFRTWRPFQASGSVVLNVIWMDDSGIPTAPIGSLVTPGSSWGSWPVVGGVSLTSPPPDWSGLRFDTWPIVVPLTWPFQYQGVRSLRIWLEYNMQATQGVLEVDAIQDGPTTTGYAMGLPQLGGVSGPGNTIWPGVCPIIGLATASPVTLPPRLQAFGEPCLGQTVLLDLTQATPGAGSWLMIGTFGSSVFGNNPNCTQHVLSPVTFTIPMPIDGAGRAQWTFPIPVTTSLLFSETACQVLVMQPPGFLSNGVLVRVGGVL